MRKLLISGTAIATLVALVFVAWPRSRFPESRTPAKAYLQLPDQFIALTGRALPGRPFPCAHEVNHPVYSEHPLQECVHMTPAQSWKGLWRNGVLSLFCELPARTCSLISRPRTLLATRAQERDGKLYEVTVQGRRTKYAGTYMGFDHVLIADRIVSSREVSEPQDSPEVRFEKNNQ